MVYAGVNKAAVQDLSHYFTYQYALRVNLGEATLELVKQPPSGQ
jgi:hypothetical protein